MYGSGCSHSLISLSGFDYPEFNEILALFAHVHNAHTPYTKTNSISRLCGNEKCGRHRHLPPLKFSPYTCHEPDQTGP